MYMYKYVYILFKSSIWISNFFFEDHVYDWVGFKKTGLNPRTKNTLKLPPPPPLGHEVVCKLDNTATKTVIDLKFCLCSSWNKP